MSIFITVKALDGPRELSIVVIGIKPDKFSLNAIVNKITRKMKNPLPVLKKDLVSVNILVTSHLNQNKQLCYRYKSAIYFWENSKMQYKSVDGEILAYSNSN